MGRASWGPWPGKGGTGGSVDDVASPDGSIGVTNPSGPTVDVVVARAVLLALSDQLPGGDSAGTGAFFMANRGTENGPTNQTDPIGYPIGPNVFNGLTVNAPQGGGANAMTVTAHVNGGAAVLTAVVPAGAAPGTVVDSALSTVTLAADDVVDILATYTQPNGGDIGLSVALKKK